MVHPTPAIELLTISADVVERIGDPNAFARLYDVDLGESASLIRLTVEQNEAFRLRIDAPAEWCGHLGLDQGSRLIVGTCAFKGAPVDGAVEIAYFTFPLFEGRGYGAAMCRALLMRAGSSGVVRLVTAHTRPENNASTRILARTGFTLYGPVADPEDGTVFRWEHAIASGRVP